jgi:hypothetical protein
MSCRTMEGGKMRCANLTRTWTDLECWFHGRDVLVLPALVANLPLVRLDSDCADADVALTRLRQLIDHFAVRAVYVERIVSNPDGDSVNCEPAVLTLRVLAAGAVHELKLFAAWYVEMLDASIGAETAY